MIRYTFEFEGQSPLVFDIDEAGWTSTGEEPGEVVLPWAELANHRCEHCSLPARAHAACPAAYSLRLVIESFSSRLSYEDVSVKVETQGKELRLRTSLQVSIRSLVGLIMALSACPVMRKLRPMAYFHLPFGNQEQTVFRAMGMYLLAQHLRAQEGLKPDWGLDGLVDLYEKIHMVNEKMAARIRMAASKDATVNGLIILDIFTLGFDHQIKKKLAEWRPLFAAYLAGC